MSAASQLVELVIDGKPVQVPAGTTIFDAARLNGIPIPTLCHLQSQTPVGVCRLCVVDTGARVLSAEAEQGEIVSHDELKRRLGL